MLYWLLQSLSAHPALAQGKAPGELLARQEKDQLAGFASLDRRRDWLLGRWTAKRLLQQIVAQQCGFEVPLHEIGIDTAADGAPLTSFREPFTGRPFSLSLSHSAGYALCAVVEGQHVPVGVDLESIEPRDGEFVKGFLNREEQMLIGEPRRRLYDMQVTAIWSAKEAALKAIRLGLHVDPRHVSCLVQPVGGEPQDWLPFRIVWQTDGLESRSLPELTGWWQALGGFVLTLATPL